jgi:Tfp pilus assembly protein PilF
MRELTLRGVGARRAHGFPLLLLPLALLLAPAAARAQLPDGPGLGDSGVRGANNTVQGNIFYPSGRRMDKRLQVRISASARGLDFSTMSDENGSFSFRRLPGGTYVVTVEAGKEYQPVSETVNVMEPYRNSPGQTYVLQIQLQLKPMTEGSPGVLNAALAGVPAGARDFYEKAVKAAQAGDNRKAVEMLKSAVELYPQFQLAFGELGVQYFRLGELDKATDALREATKLAPEAFGFHLNLGIVLFFKKQYPEAGEQLDRALKLNEGSGIAHLFRGRVFIKSNDLGKAEKEFVRALAVGGGEVNEAHRFLGGIYREHGEYARSLQELEKYLKAEPAVRDAEQIRAIMQELRAKAAEARK